MLRETAAFFRSNEQIAEKSSAELGAEVWQAWSAGASVHTISMRRASLASFAKFFRRSLHPARVLARLIDASRTDHAALQRSIDAWCDAELARGLALATVRDRRRCLAAALAAIARVLHEPRCPVLSRRTHARAVSREEIVIAMERELDCGRSRDAAALGLLLAGWTDSEICSARVRDADAIVASPLLRRALVLVAAEHPPQAPLLRTRSGNPLSRALLHEICARYSVTPARVRRLEKAP